MVLLTRQIAYIGVLVCLALFAGFIMASYDYDIQGSLLVALALVIVALFLVIPRVAAGEGKLFLKFLFLAFFIKIAASLYRFYWAVDVKSGVSDSSRYHGAGRRIAEELWNLDFNLFIAHMVPGTKFVEGLNGLVYTIIGPTLLGGFLFYAFLVFMGSCFYYKGFRLSFPNANPLVGAGLIFLFPSWLYWPSSIGKDALMAFLIGLMAYGTALFLHKAQIRSLVFIGIGLAGAFMIRPHIVALLATALGSALVFRPYRLGSLGPMVRVGMIAIAVVVGSVVITQTAAWLRLEEASLDSALQRYEGFHERGSSGGSAFEPVSITDPLGVPAGIITVLFRSFQWEAHRGAALILSLEGVFFLALMLWRFGSIKAAIVAARSNPYLIFILVYVTLCILVFTTFSNFSILGRQRLQFFPLLFMLLAHPSVAEEKKSSKLSLGRRQITSMPHRTNRTLLKKDAR
jgi:hypothetical protein